MITIMMLLASSLSEIPTQRDCYVPELPQTLVSGQGHEGHEGHEGHKEHEGLGGIEGQELPRRLQGGQGDVSSLSTIHNNRNIIFAIDLSQN